MRQVRLRWNAGRNLSTSVSLMRAASMYRRLRAGDTHAYLTNTGHMKLRGREPTMTVSKCPTPRL